IIVLSESHILTAGGSGFYLAEYEGDTWSSLNIPEGLFSGGSVTQIGITSLNDIWASVYDPYGDDVNILRYNGFQWQNAQDLIRVPNLGMGLAPICVVNTSRVYWGASGIVYYYNGDRWNSTDIDCDGIASIIFSSEDKGWLTDVTGELWSYNGVGWYFVGDYTENDNENGNDKLLINKNYNGFSTMLAQNSMNGRDSLFVLINDDWLPLSPPIPDFSNSDVITSVCGLSATDVWCHVVLSYGHEPEDGTRYQLFHWNGSTWTRIQSPVSESVTKIVMNTSDNGWAIAGSSILRYSN
ncbi:hypothetical protein K8I28_09025, partial [bacterium]|nr:hypothetical protein [bacterium]